MQRRRMSLNTLGQVLVLALVSPSAFAALWNDVSQVPAAQTMSGDSAARAAAKVDFKHRLLNADPSAIRQQLLNAASAQARSATSVGGTIELPMPDGSMRQYTVEDSPVMAAELADKYPEIKTFKVRAARFARDERPCQHYAAGFSRLSRHRRRHSVHRPGARQQCTAVPRVLQA